jgi:hypothetical protein
MYISAVERSFQVSVCGNVNNPRIGCVHNKLLREKRRLRAEDLKT